VRVGLFIPPFWLAGLAVADLWTPLAAMANTTEPVLPGPLVTPVPRRRPWVVARQPATLDHLSGGRMVLGAGGGTRSTRMMTEAVVDKGARG
jgi:alkanesulfonate monooxygenase SsuD/methylene tetrahydromethanopterin reductase-like flavin-dependent oxidoreductase (luciferase family)